MYGEITNPSQILGQIDELHPLVGYLNNGIPNINLHGTGEPTSDIGVDGQLYIQDINPPVAWIKSKGKWSKASPDELSILKISSANPDDDVQVDADKLPKSFKITSVGYDRVDITIVDGSGYKTYIFYRTDETYAERYYRCKIEDGTELAFMLPYGMGPRTVTVSKSNINDDVRQLKQDILSLEQTDTQILTSIVNINRDINNLETEQIRQNKDIDILYKISKGQTYDMVSQTESGINNPPSGAISDEVLDVQGHSLQDTTNGYQLCDVSSVVGRKLSDVISMGSLICRTTVFNLKNEKVYPRCVFADGTTLGGNFVVMFDSKSGSQSAIGQTGGDITNADNITAINFYTNSTGYEESKDKTIANLGLYTIPNASYEPYTGGVESPNPSYPQPITSVESFDIKVTGKQLLSGSATYDGFNLNGGIKDGTYKGLTVVKRRDAWNGIRKSITLKANKTYTFSLYCKCDIEKVGIIYVGFGGKTTTLGTVSMTKEWKRINYTFSPNIDGEASFRLEISNTLGANEYYYECGQMVSLSTNIDWEDYHEITRTITPPKPLNKIGSYVDKVDIESGKWVYENMSHIYDGSENWVFDNGRNRLAIFTTAVDSKDSPLQFALQRSNIGIKDIRQSTTLLGADISTGQTAIRIRTADMTAMTDISEFKTWLNNNPVTVVWTPASGKTEESISTDDLEFLKSLNYIDGDNVITVTDQEGNDVSYLVEYIVKL